jgi:hypothetical protein
MALEFADHSLGPVVEDGTLIIAARAFDSFLANSALSS